MAHQHAFVYSSQASSHILIRFYFLISCFNVTPSCYSLSVSSVCVCVCVCARVLSCFSRDQLFAAPWTIAHQAPLSMGFSRQEYWSGLPRPPPGDLPDPGIKPVSPALQADSLQLSHWGSPGEFIK